MLVSHDMTHALQTIPRFAIAQRLLFIHNWSQQMEAQGELLFAAAVKLQASSFAKDNFP